ncbi:hypothetical protein SHM7688_00192 [Shimia marina]|uniref:Uncharacterized protein n=1 Tax=Shimia marina TaxID=321267 RepID=A0A0P1F6Y6_9RHOB|nr:hypothetical protein SHM7688_00192 [Shimia marina]
MTISNSQSAPIEGFASGSASNAAGHTPELNKNFDPAP